MDKRPELWQVMHARESFKWALIRLGLVMAMAVMHALWIKSILVPVVGDSVSLSPFITGINVVAAMFYSGMITYLGRRAHTCWVEMTALNQEFNR